jgi:hypothetical protein
MAHGLAASIEAIQERFAAENDVTELSGRIRTNEMCIVSARNSRRMRRTASRLQAMNEDMNSEIRRRARRSEVFSFLTTDLQHAHMMEEQAFKQLKRQERIMRMSLRAAGNAVDPHDERVEAERRLREHEADIRLQFQMVLTVDDGNELQDTRVRVDDTCPNCGTAMHRNVQLSYLVCPNLECQCRREYIDASTYSGNTYTTRDVPKSSSNVTHYSAFLNACQGRTSRQLSPTFLSSVCYFLVVEGVTSPDQITKKLINRAQKYFMPRNEYNISAIIGTRLRGDSMRIPPDVIKKMHLIFRVLWPIFNRYKKFLEPDRRNMANFDFFSRVTVRFLGYDVFLPLFSTFELKANETRHYAFLRHLFNHLGWRWCEELSDVPEAVLDEYDARYGQEMARMLNTVES